jgi:hypothetical protein
MDRPRIVKIGASIDHFDGGEEDLWRAVDALRTDKPWYVCLYLAVDATGPGLWRLADHLLEEGWRHLKERDLYGAYELAKDNDQGGLILLMIP